MHVPLYTGIDPLPFRRRGPEYNAGLWYDKFFCHWVIKDAKWLVEEAGDNGAKNGKTKWIEAAAESPVGDRALLKDAIHRIAMLSLALGGEIRCFATDWRFVTGLGREHPVENGFAWHHTLGVPYLPGSSVKGIVRAWAGTWIEEAKENVKRIFGPEGEREEKRVGSVIFFDALPIAPVKLEADVMTPHYLEYYQQDNPEKPPGDWYDPVPIPFLTVALGQTFLFALAPRRPSDEQSRDDCRQAVEWLAEALAAIGAGAKTAVGYGRFVRLEKEEGEIRRTLAARDVAAVPPAAGESPGRSAGEPVPSAAMSPLRKEMEEDGYSRDPELFMSALTSKWIKKLQDDQMPLDDKREIAVLLKEWYLANKTEQWRKPNKKNKAKIAEIKKFLPDDA